MAQMPNGARKVLVVDGDSATRKDVRSAVAQGGYQGVEADTGPEGLRQLEALHPSLGLLEVTLPHASGCYVFPIETRVIDVHIRNLRRKIEAQPSRPYYILAVPGIGYRFTNARPT